MHIFKFVFKRMISEYVSNCFMFLRLLLISYKAQEIIIFNHKKVLFLQYILLNNFLKNMILVIMDYTEPNGSCPKNWVIDVSLIFVHF